MKATFTFFKLSVATIIVALASFAFAGCEKSDMPSFRAEYQDSLTQKDLLWMNNFVERGDSIGFITGIEKMGLDISACPQFKNKYILYITQPIDHKHPELGTFKQRVIIAFAGYDRPTEIITEGYYLFNKYFKASYTGEISKYFSTNMIIVEHRYFGKSVPFAGSIEQADPRTLNWDYFVGEQEAADLHAVRTKFGMLFKGKWVASGVSKGGLNCMTYAAYYPEDMDCSVPYVGPVCTSVSDGRTAVFMSDTTWNPEVRAKIIKFQRAMLQNRATIFPLFYSEAKSIDNTLSDDKIKRFYEYWILDYAENLYQYYYDLENVSDADTLTPMEIYNEAISYYDVSSVISYYRENPTLYQFWIQSAKEIGYYSFDVEPFKDLLTCYNGKDVPGLCMPEGLNFTFDNSLSNKIHSFLSATKSKMMFIYGANDPWTAMRPLNTVHDNLKLYIVPGENHNVIIRRMPAAMQAEALATLSGWLGVSATK
jgi:hypothetical protein